MTLPLGAGVSTRHGAPIPTTHSRHIFHKTTLSQECWLSHTSGKPERPEVDVRHSAEDGEKGTDGDEKEERERGFRLSNEANVS